MVLYVTADTHGDLTRFKQFRRRVFKRKNEVCIVCGDFGFLWDGGQQEREKLKSLSRLDCTILFVEGTHDNIDALSSFPEGSIFGARARRLAGNVWWLMRGEIYTVGQKKIFAMGGGHSLDADERIPGVNWWDDELPTYEQLTFARENLKKHNNKVDYIITHQRPSIEIGLMEQNADRANALTEFLWEISRTVEYGHWFFGGEHIDKAISRKMTAVFKNIIRLDT